MIVNSAAYASFEERKQWMEETVARIPRDKKLPHPLLAEVKLTDAEVADLQALALGFIAHSSQLPPGTSPQEMLKRLEQGQFNPDRSAHHLLIPLERRVSQILHGMAFHRSTPALEYPVNVRVVHGTPIEGYARKDYATTKIHSDIWAGEPADTLQVIIPLMGDVRRNYCQWYATNTERFELYLCNRSAYPSSVAELGEVKAIPHSFDVGTLYFFDSALPHQTIQQGGGVRLSLDFRLRRLFPYADPRWTERMQRERGAYGRYYLLPAEPYPYANFRQKLDHEIEVLEQLGLAEFADFRKKEIP